MPDFKPIPNNRRFKDISNQCFGRWLVLGYVGRGDGGVGSRWFCRCNCGTERVVRGSLLWRKESLSCGCLANEIRSVRLRTHGYSQGEAKKQGYSSWMAMMMRCYNEKHHAFPNYGGRGINVCERWKEFGNFIADMGPRPGSSYSIDRINSNGNYEPKNCRWASWDVQLNNQRRNVLVEYNGQILTLAQACRLAGILRGTAKRRMKRHQCSFEEAIKLSKRWTKNTTKTPA